MVDINNYYYLNLTDYLKNIPSNIFDVSAPELPEETSFLQFSMRMTLVLFIHLFTHTHLKCANFVFNNTTIGISRFQLPISVILIENYKKLV